MFLTLWFCNETSGIFPTANTFSEGGKEVPLLLFRVIEVFVKERVIVNPKLEENLSCFLFSCGGLQNKQHTSSEPFGNIHQKPEK